MKTSTFEQFAELVRHFAGCSSKVQITRATKFQDDLGITGEDGTELLIETEKHYGVLLHSEEHGFRVTFNLAPNEYLFNSEGFNAFELLGRLFGVKEGSTVREFTVGELYDAVTKKDAYLIRWARQNRS